MKDAHNLPIIFLIGASLLFLFGCSVPTLPEQNMNKPAPYDPCSPPDTLPTLTQQQKETLVATAYQSLERAFYGAEVRTSFDPSFDSLRYLLFVSLRHEGKNLATAEASLSNLAESVSFASTSAFGSISPSDRKKFSSASELSVEIAILSLETSSFPSASYERGVHAFTLQSPSGSSSLLAKEVTQRNLAGKTALNLLCSRAGLFEGCDADPSVEIALHDELFFGTTYLAPGIITFFRGNPLECERIFGEEGISSLYASMRSWFILQVREDGSLTYLYYPSSGSYPDDLNNEIRQLMGSRLLAQYTSENSSLLSLHKKNLDRMLASLYREEGDLAYILFENKSKLGGIAMGLRMLAASPLYGEHEEEASLLANGLLSLQNPDGSFRAWLINPSYEYDEDYLLTFYSGEAIVALTEYYALIKDERILNAAILSQNHYVDEYVTHLEENYYPAYVPWQTISLHNLYLITGNESYAEAAFALNDKLIELQNIDRTPYLDYAGRFYNSDTPQYGSPHASSDAVYTEGLIYAWHLATLLNDSTHVKRYHFAIMLSLENLDRLQFSGAKMYYLQNSVRVDGAIRSNVQSNIVRIDSTQHALDGMEAMRSFQLATNPSG